MKSMHPYQKQSLSAAVSRKALAVKTAEFKSTDNGLSGGGASWL